MSDLRIVKGNDFATLYTIRAMYADGTIVEDFDLRSCTDVQVIVHRTYSKSVASLLSANEYGSYSLEPENVLRINWDGLLVKLGTYTVDFRAKFRGADIRSYSIKDLIFDIVETNEEANIPAGAFVDNGVYVFSGDFVLMFESQVQADWDESDTSSPAYIKNKPTIPSSLAELSEDAEHRTVTDSEKSEWNNKGTYSKPQGGIPAADLTASVQASLSKADTALQSESDPTVPSWAKASTKPSYTASEVGALPASTHIPTTLAELSSDSTHRLVTDTEKATWNGKQDAIGDLETIRSGASLGATAYQKPSEGIPDSDMTVEVQDALNSAVAAYQKPSTGISKSDMASEVQSTLNKADSSVQPSSIAEFITRSVNDLANYYLKSETYTKDEVQALLDAIQGFSYEVVSSLPVASADTMGKIYLIPSSDPQVQNVKDEYITIVSSNVYEWEQIGSTAVSLEGYVTTEELNTALANYWLKSDVVNISLADVAISGSYNDLDDKPTIPYKLADMQEDVTHRVVTDAEKSTWNSKGTYSKPNSGIPASDLATEVKSSLDLANSALQEETDPTVPSWAKAANKPSYTAAEVGALPSDTFIPTKTSELTNDSDFITSADIPVQVELTSEIINSLWEAAV